MLLPAKAIKWLNVLAIVQHAVFHRGDASEVMALQMYENSLLRMHVCASILTILAGYLISRFTYYRLRVPVTLKAFAM